MDVTEQGEVLVVQPFERNLKLPEITVDVRGLTAEVIWRYVNSIYRSGYDVFRIQFDNPKDTRKYSSFSYNTLGLLHPGDNTALKLSPIEVIQLIINRCIGVEIIDQKENWCVVKELGETTYKEFDNALRRVFLLVLSLAEEILDSLKNGVKKDILKSAHLIDTNIDRFTDYCLRVLNKKGYKDYRKTPTIHSIIFLLEVVGDEFRKIAVHLMEAKEVTPKTEELFKIRYDQLRGFYELFYNFNKEKCLEIYEMDNGAHHYTEEVFDELNNDEKEILHHLKKIRVFLNNITHLRIDLEY